MQKTLDSKGGNLMSASRLATYMQCPKKYWFQYFSGIPRRAANMNLLFGSQMHKILEENDNHFIANKKYLDIETLQAKFLKEFPEVARKTSNITKKDIDKYTSLGVDMLRVYMEEIPKNEKPIMTEYEFKLQLTTSPTSIYGFIDRILEGGWIIDRKTSRCMYNEGKILEKRAQLLLYVIWYRKTYKKREAGVGLDILIKTKVPKIQRERFQVSDEEVNELAHALNVIQGNIKEGIFYPSYQNCSWCDFRDHCRKTVPCQ
jgi:CRISPR/Cas system-associated exonuclease Cas4 (RecB family)